jgi:hypothetical protein
VKLESISAIIETLNAAKVRYLVVGGLAVVAHGYLRFTNDLDLVIQLQTDNIRRTFEALGELGYRPLVQITSEQFADAGNRQRWIREKDMRVLQFWSDDHRETSIDVFVEEPFDFAIEYETALRKSLYDRLEVRVVAISTLIAMKEAADRPVDRIDVEHLRMRMNDEG